MGSARHRHALLGVLLRALEFPAGDVDEDERGEGERQLTEVARGA